MNSDLNKSSKCFGLYNDSNDIVGFCAVLHFPHPINKKIKRIHRTVILPDYQGMGLGTKFVNIIAEMYHKNGWDFRRRMSARNVIDALSKSPLWVMTDSKKNRLTGGGNDTVMYLPRNAEAVSFKYIGDLNGSR